MSAEQHVAPEQLGRVHFIGMGGAGMSAVAKLLLARGADVSGSDRQDSPALRELEALGATVFVGQRAGNVAGASTVVVSTAIAGDNPEYAAARAAGLRVLHRSEGLAAAMHGRDVVAVAGTHGKTTTSSMAALVLQHAGLGPSWAIGAHVADLGSNAALGTGRWFVAEADESDGSFLRYGPRVAVVTNIEPDHLDFYPSREAFFRAFDDFAATLPPDGLLVACQDDPGSRGLAERHRSAGGRVLTYGTDAGADVRVLPGGTDGLSTRSTLVLGEGAARREVPLVLAVPGRHNVLNAAAAFCVALEAGVDPEDAARGLAGFHGSARRFDLRGEVRGVRVFDDYAHHPTEVVAALTAAREVAGEHRVIAIFQPHLFSRTREFAAEFADALALADESLVLDIFAAREQPVAGLTSEIITDRAPAHVRYVPRGADAVAEAAGAARPGDLVLTVGAGDVTGLGARLVDSLADRSGTR
ncbi:UDP-N-acetylmuramate--L-alanine ligase [Kocuria rosea]|uniref:UDP-N-acetylmuramate--L-alanine ligase n=1 Tax=Kocuria rosea TaxID=1275 RepID=UPI00203B1CA3|nr:UDP-N-acetylmuramate--L-alanine ligase [Kocuria rosea]MCM3688365.1 UDP-N-acetylmuramate--L-alanine ligase [Kocuria rosea]HST72699.1 UDP-N-acetylmuramate--L-alanine ligase [Kocuria rosea]